jgi:uncharacterized RDD family membrane protein YckC
MKHKHLFILFGVMTSLALLPATATRGDDSAAPASAAAPAVDKANPPPATPAAEAPKPETPAPAAVAPATPAVAPAAVEAPAAPATPAVAPAPAPEAGQPEATPAPSAGLRRLDAATPATAAEVHKEIRKAVREAVRKHHETSRTGNEKVTFFYGSHVAEDEKADAAVSICGSTTVDGEVSDAAVSICGDTTVNGSAGDAAVSVFGTTRVNGSVGDAAVAVLGDVYVNGTVGDAVVAVGGNVELGPKAVVKGDIVTVGGTLERDPAAVVKGTVQVVSVGHRFPHLGGLYAWARSALFKGRLLSFASGTAWAWMLAIAVLGFYALLGLAFRPGMEKCAQTLEQHPGYTILTALLTMLATPLVFLLLIVTGVGLLVVPFLGMALWAGKVFGRASVIAWIGRRCTGLFGAGAHPHVAISVLIGGVVVMALYLVPIVALMVAFLLGFLGLGVVIYTLILSMRRNGAAKPAPVAPVMPPVAAAGLVPTVGASDAAVGAMMPPVVPLAVPVVAAAPMALPAVAPFVADATLPRAGFWIRIVASLLDGILVGVAALMIHVPGGFLLLFAAYCAVLWGLRSTTVGGVICGLKLVRLDGRKVDWSVAIVRALAGFLSLAALGLGFIWTAFDDEKQSWHDKIAGTTIVKVPKGVSLV